ncbi:MAG: PilN domain-containing protein [Magnetococcus sp. MYC-9]
MIRINLLPYRAAQRLRTLHRILMVWAATVVVGALLLLGIDLLILDEIQSRTATRNSNRQTLQELDNKLGEIKDINDRKALALTRLEIINRLSIEQSTTIHMLDELSKAIPEQVWLSKLETQKNLLSLNGLATSNAVVADFMRLLALSPYFAEIELAKVAQQEPKSTLQSFSLSLKFGIPKQSTPTAPSAAGGQPAASAAGR